MRRNPGRRMIAALLGLLLLAVQPAWTFCPHAGDASRDAPGAHDHDAGANPAPASDAPDAPDCPFGAPTGAGCGVGVSAALTSRVRLAFSDPASEPDWNVAARTDLTHASAIFHPPIG